MCLRSLFCWFDLGLFLAFGGPMTMLFSGLGLLGLYVFPPINPEVYTAEHIAEFLQIQPYLGIFCGVLFVVGLAAMIIGFSMESCGGPMD